MISGALYHRVATYSVMYPAFSSGSMEKPLASPKSQILSSQSALTSRLPGLRSRCSTFAEWMYFRPHSIWYMKDWKWASVKGWPERIMAARSHSINSAALSALCYVAGLESRTLVEVAFVEVVGTGYVHVVETGNLYTGSAACSSMWADRLSRGVVLRSCALRMVSMWHSRRMQWRRTSEVLQQLDLAQGALGQDLLAEDIGDLFDGHAFARLVVGRRTGCTQSACVCVCAWPRAGPTKRCRMRPGPAPWSHCSARRR
jgi:hypothetical protein